MEEALNLESQLFDNFYSKSERPAAEEYEKLRDEYYQDGLLVGNGSASLHGTPVSNNLPSGGNSGKSLKSPSPQHLVADE